jgi:O-antigen/teichoic acid export membrane protein
MLLASYPSGVLLPLLSVLSFYLAKNQFEFLTLYIYVAYSLLLFTICSILLKEEIRSLFKVKPKFLMKEWTQSSGKILFSVSLNQVLLRGNVLFLSSILPADQIGVYSLSARIAQAITIANRAFNRYWAVLFSKHYNNNDIQRLNRESQKSALVSFGMSALFALILLIWGRNILSIFGPDFISSYTVMLMIVLGYLTISFFSPSITLLQMCNQEQAVNRIYVISVIIMLVGLSISAPVYGTFGAACVLTSVLIHNAIHSAIICICKLKCRADPFLTN